ncbi:hypothetical protein V3G39_09475 [Dermatophilaceae bacterium Sec6.4]
MTDTQIRATDPLVDIDSLPPSGRRDSSRQHASSTEQPATRAVVYGDFTCWKCALANRRTDLLRRSGYTIEWRAIESEPGLPVRGRGRTAQESDHVAAVRRVVSTQLRTGEVMSQDLPDLVPKTTAAVSAYAEAVVANVPDQVRAQLFTAYWQHGTDIGNPEILRTLLAAQFMRSEATSDPIVRFGYAVAMTREPITTAAWRLIRQWRREWQTLQCDQLPTVTDASGTYCGDAALRRLGDLLDQPSPIAGDGFHRASSTLPDWEPPTTVEPPMQWTSQAGDPWRRAALIRQSGR